MGNLNKPFDPVLAAGQNLAVHWMEDTHQGVPNSPTKLVRVPQSVGPDKIKPDVFAGDNIKTCKETNPLEFLIRYWAMQSIRDYATGKVKPKSESDKTTDDINKDLHTPLPPQVNTEVTDVSGWRMASKKAKKAFNNFLCKIQNGDRLLLIGHA